MNIVKQTNRYGRIRPYPKFLDL